MSIFQNKPNQGKEEIKMDIRGIWKVKEVRVPTPDGEKVFTPDNPPEDERFEGAVEMMQYRTEFAEDGVLNTLMFVP